MIIKNNKFLFTLSISWFVFMCLLHYFSSRPLWLDENLVFKNMCELSFLETLGRLRYTQTFPRLYFIIINFVARLFNYNLLALRLLPLLSMLLAFLIWLRVYQQALSNKWQILLTVLSFANSYRVIYYASELKHYSMEILITGIFCWYLIHQKQIDSKTPSKPFIITTLLLPFTLVLSYSSFFLFWIVIYNFLFMIKKNRKTAILLAAYAFLCILLIIFVYYVDLRYALTGDSSYWNDYFLCTQSFYCFIKPFGEGVRKITIWCFSNSRSLRSIASILIPYFILSLFGYGIQSLRKNKLMVRDVDALGLIIFLEMVVLGIAKKYPFTGARITLFFTPFVFYFIIKGIGFLKKNKPLYLISYTFYFLFLIMCGLNSFISYLKLYVNK